MEGCNCARYAAFDSNASELVVALSDIDETRSAGKRWKRNLKIWIFFTERQRKSCVQHVSESNISKYMNPKE